MEQVEDILSDVEKLHEKLQNAHALCGLEKDEFGWLQSSVKMDSLQRVKSLMEQCKERIPVITEEIESLIRDIEEVEAREEVIEKLRAAFPSFDSWQDEPKNALIDKGMTNLTMSQVKETLKNICDTASDTLDQISELTNKNESQVGEDRGISRYYTEKNYTRQSSSKSIIGQLQNITILAGDDFSEEFLHFYYALDPTPASHGTQKYNVRQYLLSQGYDEYLVDSLKGNKRKRRARHYTESDNAPSYRVRENISFHEIEKAEEKEPESTPRDGYDEVDYFDI